MTEDSPRHQEGEKDIRDKKDDKVSAIRSVDNRAWVRDLGLTLSPGSQVQRGADHEPKYDVESPSLSCDGDCGRSSPWNCSQDISVMKMVGLDEPIESIPGSCECTQLPSDDSDLGKLASALSSAHNYKTSSILNFLLSYIIPTHLYISTIINSTRNIASTAPPLFY